MSTFMPNSGTITRKWYLIDATGKPLGRVAAQVAVLLRGKHKVIFTPHVDCGDHVIIVNVDKVILTGNKLEKKFYRHHSGWVGGLKEVQYKILMAKEPQKAMLLAVKRMIPATVIGRAALGRMRLYVGPDHDQAAQQPETFTF